MKSVILSKAKTITLIFWASFSIGGAISIQAFAQSMTQEQIDQMASMMRANGQTEDQVNQFIEQMKGVQKMSQDIEANEAKGMSEMQAASKAAGYSDKEVADMDKVDQDIAALEKRSNDIALEHKRDEFNKKHGGKPVAIVKLGSKSYSLQVKSCDIDDKTYKIEAEGLPGAKKVSLTAQRAYSHLQKIYYKSIQFRAGSIRADINKNAGELAGKNFNFEGMNTVYDIKSGDKSEQLVTIDLSCP